MKNKLEELRRARENLLEGRKFWNTNRIFLAWAFTSSLLLTTGIELAKLINPESNYPIIFGILFFFALILLIFFNRIIDGRASSIDKTYKTIDEQIKRLENKK